MDVSLSGRRVISLCFAVLIFVPLISCGNRYDLSTERGRRARIDDANFHLSKGECGAATEAIDPLYGSIYVDDEVRIIKASANACFANYNLLKLAGGISGASNYFQALAKALDNTRGDGAREYMYSAVDVLTQKGATLDSHQRSASLNTYMVFLQFGVISAILRNYGNPNSDGTQGISLVYETAGANPDGEMGNIDACALAASFSHISNSIGSSDLNDSDTTALSAAMDAVCTGAGLASCAALSRDRTACDGVNADSEDAADIVLGVNAAW